MANITLARTETSDQGTFGRIHLLGETYHTLELPWRENKRQISCIPKGWYECSLVHSPRFGVVYQVRNVPGRSGILFHWGNYAGDRAAGYHSHSYGCILLGQRVGILAGQAAILNSLPTVRKFNKLLNKNSFDLLIKDME